VRRALKNLLFSVLTAGLLLGGAELTLRLLDWPDTGLYAGDIASVWWLKANLDETVPFPEESRSFHVTTDALGFRDSHPDAVACLGDSTTFGWGVDAEQTWCRYLAGHLGSTSNLGVPGYSTHQALATVGRTLATRPRAVILAFVVRDAQLSHAPDHLAPPPRPRPRLMDALGGLVRRNATPPPATLPRVDAERFGENLDALIQTFTDAGVEVRLLSFPMVEPALEHQAELRERGAISVSLPRDQFFEHDPIHLTPEGHQAMAQQVAEAW